MGASIRTPVGLLSFSKTSPPFTRVFSSIPARFNALSLTIYA
tara:strand:- start:290 stop:415 length:126 start_codon:yes stop_codon:yes gene_type:complete